MQILKGKSDVRRRSRIRLIVVLILLAVATSILVRTLFTSPVLFGSGAFKAFGTVSDAAESPGWAEESCVGRYVYMYDLPSTFNQEFLDNCARIHRSINMCPAFSNSGAGTPAKGGNSSLPDLLPESCWFESDQFSLEIIFHARMKEYKCLTQDPTQASLFYIPFYAGLSVFKSLYEPDLADRDKFGKPLVEWLAQSPWWDRHHGMDHVQVVTRVLIDFTREYVRSDWGCNLMAHSHMQNVTFLGIEASPQWVTNAVTVPYPTSFHPSTDRDVVVWQHFVRQYPRQKLVSFAGSGHGMGEQIRHRLWKTCVDHAEDCEFFNCRERRCIMQTQNVMWAYLGARFCIQPPGDTPTRKGLWDCMVAGGIPVVLHPETAFPAYMHLPTDHSNYLVYISEKEFWKDEGASLMTKLRSIPEAEVKRLQQNVIDLIPRITYAMPGRTAHHKDAFDLAVDGAVARVAAMKLPGHPSRSALKV